MAKERDWIDYANLASNLTQNLQLRRANQTLEGLERVAAERAIREQEEHDQERELNRLREHISQISDDVESLQKHLRENLRAALALGLQIKGLMDKHDVTTASFSMWEDKDRLKKVTGALEAVCEQSAALLATQQREDAAKCAKFLAERDALDQLISLQRRREVFDLGQRRFEKQIVAKRNELGKLKFEHSCVHVPVRQRACSLVGGLGLVFAVFWLLGLLMSGPLETGSYPWSPKAVPAGPPCSVPGGATFVIFLISLPLAVSPLFARTRTRQRALVKQIKALEAEISNTEAELSRYAESSPIKPRAPTSGPYSDPSGRDYEREREQIMIERGNFSKNWATQDTLDELYAMFGSGLSSEAYEANKRERDAFIDSIFGAAERASDVSTKD